MCKDQWDDSEYLDSCANQKGCTDCDSSGYTWCFPTDRECDEVERYDDGTNDSANWFKCDAGISKSIFPRLSSLIFL